MTLVTGAPNLDLISTSYAERNYLTMQMSMRRFTRLTNAFSKKLENYAAQVALHFWYYSFCRTHATLKTTPAVAGRRYLLPVYDLTSEAVENDHGSHQPRFVTGVSWGMSRLIAYSWVAEHPWGGCRRVPPESP